MTRIQESRVALRPLPFDLMRTALLLCAFLSFAAGASLIGREGAVEGEGSVFVIASLALVVGIIIFVLFIAD